jgi:hypothetical protein
MIRQQRRRLERQWNKIKISETCTEFIERNNLFALPHVIAFQAIKISEELACVYNVGLFESKKDKGHGEFVTVCWFVNGSLRSVGFVQIAFIPKDYLWENEEIDE